MPGNALDLPCWRVLNIAWGIILDSTAFDEDKRKELVALLDWPEAAEMESSDAQDRAARQSVAAFGGGNIEEMFANAARARERAIAELERRKIAEAQG